MEQKKVNKPKQIGITPMTKRIGIICFAVVATVTVIGTAYGSIEFRDGALIVLPIITSISALIDGGR